MQKMGLILIDKKIIDMGISCLFKIEFLFVFFFYTYR